MNTASTPFGVARRRGHAPSLAVITGGDASRAPSSTASVQSFIAAAASVGLDAFCCDLDDADHVSSASAGFLRTYTEIGGKADQLASAFELSGRPVIDRPASIRRGSDKILQSLIFARLGLAAPRSHFVLHESHITQAIASIGSWPIVVKDPAGSFSKGIYLAQNPNELRDRLEPMLAASSGVLIQEFVPTAFDWRIGVLDGEVLFAARYFMAKGAWTICDRVDGLERWGHAEPVRIADIPRPVRDAAVQASRGLGVGLWGVDVKVAGDRALVLEVNDNPNIDDDVEAAVPEDGVWQTLGRWFAARITQAERESVLDCA